MSSISVSDVYKNTALPKVASEMGIKNPMALPRIEKIVVAVGFGKNARKGGSNNMDEARIEEISRNISIITGQKPTVRKAKKSVSNFKIRAGQPVGLLVTLRGSRALNFLGRFIHLAIPRVRDFRGIASKLDGQGNYTVGIQDQSIFPEINPESAEQTHGLEVTVVTTTKDDEAAKMLLALLGMPFKKPTT